MSNVQVIKHEPPAQTALTPMDMLNQAVSQGANIDVLEKLMALQERWEKNQARKAFEEAMASAKAEIPVIIKNREVDFTSQKGRTHYWYEDLSAVANAVTPILARHGLSYRFRTSSPPNEPITVTCIISHRLGHCEENTLCGPRDDTGNKNNIQQVGSTLTYLQRMTLKAALGLSAAKDDDGRATSAPPRQTIDAEEAQTIRDRLAAIGMSEAKFLAWVRTTQRGVEKIEDIDAELFDSCQEAILKASRAKKNG
jgi:hypothetical protein